MTDVNGAGLVDREVERLAAGAVELRHQIHRNPELSNREFATARLIAVHLEQLELEVETGIAGTGVVGIVHGRAPGRIVAVRADMDALPITEETPYPFRSTVRTEYMGEEVGVSHACGHDVHVAVQLGVAAVLASLRDQFIGTVKLIFQPAEEQGFGPGEEGGAIVMVREGVLERPRPEVIFALHTAPHLEVGTAGCAIGPLFAATDLFRIRIKGKQAHGAEPHLGIDAITIAAQVVVALHAMRALNVPPLEGAVIVVGRIQGGTRYDILADEVVLEGGIRTHGRECRELFRRRVLEVVSGTVAAGGGKSEVEYVPLLPPIANEPILARRVMSVLGGVLGPDNVKEHPPMMASEDFGFYLDDIPGCYFFLGTCKPGGRSGSYHSRDFMADDGAIPVGIRAMTGVVLDWLARGPDPA